MLDEVFQHLLQVIEFGFAIALRVVNAIINHPKLVGLRIDINASDHTDAFDDVVSVATILPPHEFDLERVVLIQDRVIKEDKALWGDDQLRAHLLPQQPRLNAVISQVAVDGIVRERLRVLGKVRQGVIDLTTEQILAVVKSRYGSWLLSHRYDFTQSPRAMSFQRTFFA